MMTFGEFAKQLELAARACRPRLEATLPKIGTMTADTAKEFIGHELPERWAPLADRTIEEKTKLGFVGHVSPTDPLLRTGTLRESITVAVEGLTMMVGSNDPVARYQEEGTATIPPRPFIAPATMQAIPYAEGLLGEIAKTILTKEI